MIFPFFLLFLPICPLKGDDKSPSDSEKDSEKTVETPLDLPTEEPEMVSDQEKFYIKNFSKWSVFLSNNLGIGSTKSENTDYESNKSGWIVEPSLGIRFQQLEWSASLGLGWMLSHLFSDPAPLPHPDNGADRSYVNTRLGAISLSGHYRLQEQHRLGLLTKILFGTDSTFSPWEGADESPNVLLGLEYQFEKVFTKDLSWFAGVSFTHDVTILERRFMKVDGVLGVQIHLGKNQSQETVETVVTPPEPVIQTVVKYKIKETFVYPLDSEFIRFTFNSYELTSNSQTLLKEIGSFLAAHQDAWEALSIEGHTDTNGDATYNQHLSEKRAETVLKVFEKSGISKEKISSKGFGSSRVLIEGNSLDIHARNRRVEIHFKGIKDPQKMIEGLNRIKFKHKPI
jgi:outer membrane protein OmpA-like peptidoglycan-associated protein